MGTSASSSGPGGGVVLVPPWVNDPEGTAPEPPDAGELEEAAGDADDRKQVPMELAPARRFVGARLNLGAFAASGSRDSLKRGLGHYVSRGLGGSGRASQRMAGTARKAGQLYDVLQSLGGGIAPTVDLRIDLALLAGRTAREIVDRISEALSPSDGTLDSEASRNSISWALCEFMRLEPTVDLTALHGEQIELVIELFIGEDICRRIELDVGKTVFAKAAGAAAAIRRLDQMCRYVRESVAASFRRRRASLGHFTRRVVNRLASNVIRDTYEVFGGYIS